MKSRGFGLLEVVMASGLMAIVSMGFFAMFRYQSQANRDMSAKAGTMDLSNALNLIFGGPRCSTTGAYNNAGAPATVAVSGANYALALDTIRFPNGTMALTSTPNPAMAAMIQPNWIQAITLTPLGGQAAAGAGFAYPFNLTVSFRVDKGMPPRPLTKFIVVYTNAANAVVGACFAGGTAGTVVRTGQVGQGATIAPPAGYLRSDCTLLVAMEDTHLGPAQGDYSSGWGDGVNWLDNHYGGAQAFYDTNWNVTCRFGFHYFNSFGQPTWHAGGCRYLMTCTK